MRRAAALALLCGSLSFAPLAGAQESGPTDADKAAAQVLFDEGRALMADESYDAACAKFAESMRLDRAIGTQLNLGLCYEKAGRYASAWINFEEARARAAKEGQENRVELASEYANRLSDRLSKIRVVVPEAPEGLVIERDGEEVGEAQWGIEVPIDGGSHRITATAPGKLPYETTIEVQPESDQVELTIPALEDAPVKPDPVPPPPVVVTAPPEGPDGLLIGGIVALGVGGLGLGFGAAFGVLAMNKDADSADACPQPPNGCTPEGVSLRDEAFTFAHVSTAGFVVGGVGLGAGLLMVLLSGGEDEAADEQAGLQLEPWVDSQGGLGLRGVW